MKCTIATAFACAAGLIGGIAITPSTFAQAVPDDDDSNPFAAHVLPALSLVPNPIPIAATTSLNPLDVPYYSSRPTASAKIYLDFDGDYTPVWGGYAPLTTPAYDIDGDVTTYSDQELTNINEICQRVAEAYSPFNITVTTVDPGPLFDHEAMRVVIGGDGKNETGNYWVGQKAGGVAFVGGFAGFQDNTVFVFPKNLANGVPKYTGMAAAHEAGHSFGLQHQSLWPPGGGKIEYNPGDSAEAPFMGTAYGAIRGIWYVGTSNLPLRIQDDVAIIAGSDNQFGYYTDNDAGDSPSQAEAAPDIAIDVPFVINGLITTTADKDFYSFVTNEDTIATFGVQGAQFGGMLDPDLGLYDAVSGDLLEMINWGGLGEGFTTLLPPGTYDIAVLSHGNAGDIGQYTLSGYIVGTIPEPACASMILLLLPLLGRNRRAHS